MEQERVITKELVLKAYCRMQRIEKRIKAGLFDPSDADNKSYTHTCIARTYIKKLRSGRLVYFYRIGPGARYAKLTVGKKMITLTSVETGQSKRAAIPSITE